MFSRLPCKALCPVMLNASYKYSLQSRIIDFLQITFVILPFPSQTSCLSMVIKRLAVLLSKKAVTRTTKGTCDTYLNIGRLALGANLKQRDHSQVGFNRAMFI